MMGPLKLLTTTLLALGALCMAGTASTEARTFVYVSNSQDSNIDVYAMDAKGALTPVAKADAGKLVMPMAISPSKKFLYAAVRSEPFKVITYAIDAKTGALTQKASAPLPDSMPYVSTDTTGRFLFTASYGGHKIAVNPIGADGLVTAAASQVLATGKNAHAIFADRTNKFVYATTLGGNQVLQYKFDAKSGILQPNEPAEVKARPDHGPRHFRITADNRFLYVLNELSGHIAQYAIDQKSGTLKELDSVPSVPADAGLAPGVPQVPFGTAPPAAAPKADDKPKIWAADLQLTPNGKFLYSTERTTSKIALFSVAPKTGKLAYVTNFATEKQPRGIKIDPSGKFLIASGEKSDKLAVYRIDPARGTLTEAGRYPVGNGANWVEIVTLP
jgi:6-phosphogluconolactonase